MLLVTSPTYVHIIRKQRQPSVRSVDKAQLPTWRFRCALPSCSLHLSGAEAAAPSSTVAAHFTWLCVKAWTFFSRHARTCSSYAFSPRGLIRSIPLSKFPLLALPPVTDSLHVAYCRCWAAASDASNGIRTLATVKLVYSMLDALKPCR
jgi:hypothetical protein